MFTIEYILKKMCEDMMLTTYGSDMWLNLSTLYYRKLRL